MFTVHPVERSVRFDGGDMIKVGLREGLENVNCNELVQTTARADCTRYSCLCPIVRLCLTLISGYSCGTDRTCICFLM